MSRIVLALGITLMILPFPAMWALRTFLPEAGLTTMTDAELYQTKTYTYAVIAVFTMIVGAICALIGALKHAHECHRDNVRDYCSGRD